MKLRDKLELAELYHNLAQNSITPIMTSYLENMSWVIRHALGQPSKQRLARIFALEKNVAEAAEKIEGLLENLHADIISELDSNGG